MSGARELQPRWRAAAPRAEMESAGPGCTVSVTRGVMAHVAHLARLGVARGARARAARAQHTSVVGRYLGVGVQLALSVPSIA